MGLRGPQPETAETLRRRGSTLARTREREEARASKPRAKKRRRARPIETPRRPLPATLEEWRALCSSLPGYDPWDQAEGYTFDPELAARAIDWIETHCRHVKGELAGTLIRLEDFQRAIVANLFGWVDEDGWRRYGRVLYYVPRKNAKTTLAACIGLYVLFEDDEPGAELYSFAAKREQAAIVWELARSMIAREPAMMARLHKGKLYQHSILLDDGESFWQTLASEGKGEHGRSTHFAVGDEVHAWATGTIMEAVETSFGGRRQPLMLLLTTADAVGESACNDELAMAKLVRSNKGDRESPGYNPNYLPVIYEATVEDDWSDVNVWRRVNPLFDTSPTIQSTLAKEVRKAKDQPSYLNAFRRWYLNVQTETATAWLRSDHWDQCSAPPEVEPGDRCYLGVDISTTTDMTAVVAYFPDTHSVLPFFWVPEETALKRDRQNDPWYRRWSGAGALTLTDGDYINHDLIVDRISELAETYKVLEIGLDPAFSRATSQDLTRRGLSHKFVRQGWVTMNEPCSRLEVLLASGALKHGGHPVLSWNARNVKVKVESHGTKAPVKPKDSAKIDGIVALLMALHLASVEEEPKVGPRIRSLVR